MIYSGRNYTQGRNLNSKEGLFRFGDTQASSPFSSSSDMGFWVKSSNSHLYFWNGSSDMDISAAGGGGTGATWESLYASDTTFNITSGTWALSQSAAAGLVSFTKTNVGAGDVVTIANSGSGKDLVGPAWSLISTGSVGILELTSGGTINTTGGALSIGKTGTATTFLGTVTSAEKLTVTAGGLTVTAGDLTVTSGNIVHTLGNFTVSAGVTTLISTSNAAPTLLLTNNTITTYGATTASAGAAVLRSTSLTTGTLLKLQLAEGTLNGGFYLEAYDTTAGAANFTIGEDGATTILGVAGGGATSLTLTAGDAVFSDGSLAITDADNAASFTVTNNTATSNSVFVLAGSGVFTGTTTTAFATITASGLTTGSLLYLATAALTTGKVINISATAATDGILINATGGGANMTATGGIATFAMGAATAGAGLRITTTGVYSGAGLLQISATSATTGVLASIDGSGLTSGTGLKISATEATLTTGKYIDCYDGGASDFTVSKYGAVVIAGNAATNVLTITAGHAVLTSGNLVLTSGNATLTSGNLLLTSGNATLTAGNLILTAGTVIETAQAILNANTAISVTHGVTKIANNGVSSHTLADGVEGQRKTIICTVYAGDAVITPANLANGTTITLNAAGDGCTLVFLGTEWFVETLYGTAALA